VQLQDGLVKGWALWGEYLQSLFEVDSSMTLGLSVLTCYLHACRTMKEAKCRKYLAYIIWLLTHDDASGSMAEVKGGWRNGFKSHRKFRGVHFSKRWMEKGFRDLEECLLVSFSSWY